MNYQIKTILLNSIFYPAVIFFVFLGLILIGNIVFLIRIIFSKRKALYWLRKIISYGSNFIVDCLTLGLVKVDYCDYQPRDSLAGAIFICNHRSASDALLVGRLPDESVQVVNVWPFRIPVIGAIARLAGYLSVREMNFRVFLEKGSKLLKEGVSIIAFPEGTRSASKRIGQFHSSLFRLAIKARCPIVPVCISGNENVPVKGSLLLKPGKIKIDKLRHLQWQDYKNLTPFVLKNKVREIMTKHLYTREGN